MHTTTLYRLNFIMSGERYWPWSIVLKSSQRLGKRHEFATGSSQRSAPTGAAGSAQSVVVAMEALIALLCFTLTDADYQGESLASVEETAEQALQKLQDMQLNGISAPKKADSNAGDKGEHLPASRKLLSP